MVRLSSNLVPQSQPAHHIGNARPQCGRRGRFRATTSPLPSEPNGRGKTQPCTYVLKGIVIIIILIYQIYPRPDGTVYICGEGDSDPLPSHPRDVSFVEAKCKSLAEKGGLVCPELKGAKVLKSQACYLPCRCDCENLAFLLGTVCMIFLQLQRIPSDRPAPRLRGRLHRHWPQLLGHPRRTRNRKMHGRAHVEGKDRHGRSVCFRTLTFPSKFAQICIARQALYGIKLMQAFFDLVQISATYPQSSRMKLAF